jgi:ATPase subunit of ABC transporter with duplicated ATPase domains
MISFSNINKQYGKQLLFVDASFQLNPGEKVGLVGPNGSGKTTLFRMVVGEETPDDGTVSVPKKLTIGYFRQDVEEMQGRSVLDEAIAGSAIILNKPDRRERTAGQRWGPLSWVFSGGHIRSPVSRSPLGECNAIKSYGFGHNKLTFAGTVD